MTIEEEKNDRRGWREEETNLQAEVKTAEIHPDVAAWNKFKAENKESFRADTITSDKYLENRLWTAFFAGRDYAASQFKSSPLPDQHFEQGEKKFTIKDLDAAFQAGSHANEYDQWVKENYSFDEWLASFKKRN